jgi:S1-C subfamily serine protease
MALAGCGPGVQSSTASGDPKPTATATSKHSKSGTSSSVPETTEEKLAERAIGAAGPAVVEVINVGVGLGSGVILTKDGYIVTNDHVVKNAHQLKVKLVDGRELGASIRGTDPVDDLAVIHVKGNNLPAATLGNSADLTVGQTVLAIGNPLGIENTATEGIVSALHRIIPEGQSGGSILNAIQTSAPINPGNSGGALINLGGQVIGIPTVALVDPESGTPANGVGFAIPSNEVQFIAAQIIKYGKVQHSGRAALGIEAQTVTPDVAAQYNLPVDHGVLIAGFSQNSPAEKAGLERGDIIVKVDSTPIATYDDLLTVLAHHKPGDTLTVTVVDTNGHTHSYKVKLGELNVNSK